MGIWDSIKSGAGSVWNYAKDTAVLAKDSAVDIFAPSSTWEARFMGASNLVGFVPFYGDIAEAACSVASTTIGICKDPQNWKQRLAEGGADLAVTFCPGPKALLKIPEKHLMKLATKPLLKGSKEVLDEVAENYVIAPLIHEGAQKGIENASAVVEQSSMPETVKFKTSTEVLQLAKEDYINHLKQTGQLQYDKDGKPVLTEEQNKVVYDTYKQTSKLMEENGTKIILSPSHINNAVVPNFDVIRAHDVAEEKSMHEGIGASALPNLNQQELSRP